MVKPNDFAIKALKPQEKTRKYTLGNGLTIKVYKSGKKVWIYRYLRDSKDQTYTIGTYDYITLKEAIEIVYELKKLRAQGIDPIEHKKSTKQKKALKCENTFAVVSEEWLTWQGKRQNDSTKAATMGVLKIHILPHVGDIPINDITSKQILEVIRKIEAAGKHNVKSKAMSIVSRIFRFAVGEGKANQDVARDIKDLLIPLEVNHYPAITDMKELSILLQRIDNCHSEVVIKKALQIAPYIFVRPGELCSIKWSDIDFESKTLHIPQQRMKKRVKHLVPLAPQVIDLLKELQQYTGCYEHIFYSHLSTSKHITTATVLKALRKLGYKKDEITTHGFRHTASTFLNEQGFNRDWIEKQLSHCDTNKVRRTYNYADYIDGRREMMYAWANTLNELKKVA